MVDPVVDPADAVNVALGHVAQADPVDRVDPAAVDPAVNGRSGRSGRNERRSG